MGAYAYAAFNCEQFVIDQLGGYGESVPALTDDGLGAYDAVVNQIIK